VTDVVSGLVVTGGTVLTPAGPVLADVEIVAGRIVSADPNVGTTGAASGGPPGRSDQGTVGAGAERVPVGASGVEDAASVVGKRFPAAGGGSPGVGAPPEALSAAGLLVVPGFVDLQCNGAVGVDLATEPERLWEVAAALPRWGVTAWLPTVVTGPPDVRHRALATVRAGPPTGTTPGATPLGLHLEGPFLAPGRRGAHPTEHLRPPDPAVPGAEDWAGAVALVTLAPELPGALDLVAGLVERGIAVSVGHTEATADQVRAALDAGAGYVTHLFNAMAPLHHREPGPAGVALTDDRVRAGIIADGIHVDPAMVALAARALGPRLSLVTDAVAALGVPPGPVRIGDRWATARDDAVRLPDGTLAGSTLALDRAVRNLVAWTGAPLADAVAAVTTTPAAVLGVPDRGIVAPGAVGDLVLLDPGGEVVATVVAGRVLHDRRAA
jgi:N-acetylglucosamine-6-phosphate deacetylase